MNWVILSAESRPRSSWINVRAQELIGPDGTQQQMPAGVEQGETVHPDGGGHQVTELWKDDKKVFYGYLVASKGGLTIHPLVRKEDDYGNLIGRHDAWINKAGESFSQTHPNFEKSFAFASVDNGDGKDQVGMGVKVEMEHKDTVKWLVEKLGGKADEALIKEVATKIAEDHLKEMPDYYTRLKAMEKGGSKVEATEDIEMALEDWQKKNPGKTVTKRDASGIRYKDESGSEQVLSWESIRPKTSDQSEQIKKAKELLDQLGGAEGAIAALEQMNPRSASWVVLSEGEKPGIAQTVSEIGQGAKEKIVNGLMAVMMAVIGWNAEQIVNNPREAVQKLEAQLAAQQGHPSEMKAEAPREIVLNRNLDYGTDDPYALMEGRPSNKKWIDFYYEEYKNEDWYGQRPMNNNAFEWIWANVILPRIKATDKKRGWKTGGYQGDPSLRSVQTQAANAFYEFVRQYNNQIKQAQNPKG